jgi:hypothetical protein
MKRLTNAWCLAVADRSVAAADRVMGEKGPRLTHERKLIQLAAIAQVRSIAKAVRKLDRKSQPRKKV